MQIQTYNNNNSFLICNILYFILIIRLIKQNTVSFNLTIFRRRLSQIIVYYMRWNSKFVLYSLVSYFVRNKFIIHFFAIHLCNISIICDSYFLFFFVNLLFIYNFDSSLNAVDHSLDIPID